MKILTPSIFLILISNMCFSQKVIDWSPGYRLNLSDFQSTSSEINNELTSYYIHPGTNMDFSFQMSSYEFMFTKNFNSKVRTTFNKAAASIIAPDSSLAFQLLKFGQYSFDLTELYSRKFRKELYLQKGTFSNAGFFKPIFEKLQIEMNETNARVLKESELGKNRKILEKEHQLVLAEIESLSDFCKDCKPPKKKKKK